MKTTLYLNGKKTTHHAIKKLIGADALERFILYATEEFWNDPFTENTFMTASGLLTIRFE